ncbi:MULTISPECIES: HlyD family secretion protein [Segatella]|jgi:HlyD family secretion protein|uniref:Immunoreactive 36 kDa antigen PG14 n=2 Tax=Segatella TaxID=2974251 RepID=D8DWK1_9BACT|nr:MULTISPECIES: efflux RND transporter periplasmic adaptor subunit [Segatella]MBQ3857729.1 efflux RND transporter periplasmic adaptor subunit [Prevotella sp.]EFI72261.1 immunoreactive 36 kDa antigen PG14 [Segatella baroniae B14]MDR4930754.1 efflux RND transporter periplasmic adaptor subunit [Segatella bryantii]MEE3415249.1 efflux RND transporter periplasmic adaptor subunit [Prevotella sp.]OYP53480.1 hemolysin secretion protein D [Segatella bryantii]
MSKTSQHRNILLAIGGFISVIVIVGTIGYFTVDREPTTIQGSLEVSEYRVSCKLPGRIKEIRVQEGEIVHKGDTLAILEIPEINAQEDVAKATAGATEALSDLVEAPTRKETVEAAYQLYQQAVAAMGIAEKTFGRTDRLYAEGVVTGQKRDEAQAAYTAAKAAVAAAKSQWELAKNGARAQQKEAAIEQAKAARSAVNVVKSVLKETIQVATHDGEVSTIYPKVGELVGLGSPIMSISIMDDMWGTFNVREDELKGLKIGDTFTAFVPAFNKDIKMKVYAMKDAGSYATWKATKTTGQYDLKTFQVKARPINKFEGLRPGMSLIVKK